MICDPLTFHLLIPSGQNFNVANTWVDDQIPANLMTFPSAASLSGRNEVSPMQLMFSCAPNTPRLSSQAVIGLILRSLIH